MASPKIFQTGAFRLERANTSTPHLGWGKQPAATIRDTDGLPYIGFSNTPTLNHVEDNQVTSNAFKTSDRLVGKLYEGEFETLEKYTGQNDFTFFNFQWEDKVIKVSLVKGTVTVAPEIGDVFSQGVNDYTLIGIAPSRTVTGTDEIIYILQITAGTAPTVTGLITNETTSGSDITGTSNSGVVYRHRFLLDRLGRNLRDFTAAEITALGAQYAVGDKKSPFATMAKRIDKNYDFVYANTLATGFELTCSGADLFHLKSSLAAPYQNRAKVIPETVSIACEQASLANAPAHYQTLVRMALYGADLVEYGITDISVKAESPVQKLQTTTSGMGMAEPYLEGKYNLSASLTIGRHEQQELQDYRDGNTAMHGDITMVQGWKVHQLYMKNFTLKQAGPDDGQVAAEPLECSISWDCASTIGDSQNSPIIYDIYDTTDVNSMTGRNLLGVLV